MDVFKKFWSRHTPRSGLFYQRVPVESRDDLAPLLTPSSGAKSDPEGDEEAIATPPTKSWLRRHHVPLLVVATLLVGLVAATLTALHQRHRSSSPPPPPLPPSPPAPESTEPLDLDDPAVAARLSVDALFSCQSSTLAQATARYTLKNRRPPPRNYDQWCQFAQRHSCLIDEYDQILRDFAPWYQLAEDDPGFFQRMIDIADEMIKHDSKWIANVVIRDGKVEMPAITPYWGPWSDTFSQFSSHLPDMKFLINGMDEPRVVFDYRAFGARDKALNVSDPVPFDISPNPTSEFFRPRPACNIPLRPEGFTETANDDSAFIISSARTQFSLDFFPVLSMTRISPCFGDILFPIEYYYTRSWWSGTSKFAYPDNVPWDEKKSQIYWRGTSSGGYIHGTNYHNFTRFKLVKLSQAHSDLVDAKMTSFADELCGDAVECDRDTIIAQYNISGPSSPREDEYQYKYLLDVDGMSFSGRYLGLLRSGSLVFKATVFEEYFNDWLRPFEHYIPVLPDLSDLLEKMEWAMENDEEARVIQERGREMAQRVMTDAQNDCYFFLVLLEYARLQEIARDAASRG
ncbi:glycosyl transferase family 90-domain-containing protein [Mycena filopes]|nr:glycosyl transferase family 90-domain-containing protein [Mycena filopes]